MFTLESIINVIKYLKGTTEIECETAWRNGIKNELNQQIYKARRYQYNGRDIWNKIIISNDELKKIVEAKKIKSYEELDMKAEEYRNDYYI